MRGLPGWVLSNHAEDEILNYLGGRSSPNRLSTEINSQYQRNPARCHRTTVSGVTTESACFQPRQNRRTSSQKNLPSDYSP